MNQFILGDWTLRLLLSLQDCSDEELNELSEQHSGWDFIKLRDTFNDCMKAASEIRDKQKIVEYTQELLERRH